CHVIFICFFFFQAEDGIRDYKVTGVQTCALPISVTARPIWIKGYPLIQIGLAVTAEEGIPIFHKTFPGHIHDSRTFVDISNDLRSEERRVGKECRSRWWPWQ